jgi:hypothetical protein
MMLRESSKASGEAVNLNTVTAGDDVDSGVQAQGELLALVDATLNQAPAPQLADARDAIVQQLDAAALIDAAAVIGNFQRMTRIADGTGLPLDEPVTALTVELREELGINEFSSAEYTPKVGWLKQRLIKVLFPVILKQMRKRAADS